MAGNWASSGDRPLVPEFWIYCAGSHSLLDLCAKLLSVNGKKARKLLVGFSRCANTASGFNVSRYPFYLVSQKAQEPDMQVWGSNCLFCLELCNASALQICFRTALSLCSHFMGEPWWQAGTFQFSRTHFVLGMKLSLHCPVLAAYVLHRLGFEY